MKLKNYLIVSVLAIFVLFTGCSKEVNEYNKPAMYWYGKIVEEVSNGDLEVADAYYSSLQGEHIGSPLLPEATMILAIAHMYFEEYLLSEHFLDEYIKRYATANEKEEAEFLKIRAKYMALPNPRRDQALINEAIASAEKFNRNYPNSMYKEVVNTMVTRLYLAQAVLNETIASLYDRIDKPKSAEYYRSIKPQPWIKWADIDRANTSWYREWFEGDGTSSWYEVMIPDTKSVVSRNSIKSDDEEKTIKQEINSKENSSSWYSSLNPWSDSKDEKIPKIEKKVQIQEVKHKELKQEVKNLELKHEEVKHEVVKKEVKQVEETSSWYDAINPWSDSKEDIKAKEIEQDKVLKSEKLNEDTAPWYEAVDFWSDNPADEDSKKVKIIKKVEKQDVKETSWYAKPFTDDAQTKEEQLSNLKDVTEYEDDKGSNWYDFMNPFSSNNEGK